MEKPCITMRPFLELPGDVAEIGVFRGANLIEMFGSMGHVAKTLWGFDSFQGMSDPGEFDNGDAYPKGKLCASVAQVTANCMKHGQEYQKIRFEEGWIPVVFKQACIDRARFCFVYVDVDHCEPTAFALNFAWDHLVEGGGILMDDYLPPPVCNECRGEGCPECHDGVQWPAKGATLAILGWIAMHAGKVDAHVRRVGDRVLITKGETHG